MGSSGEKRKGRQHLPKVGTRPAMEQQLHDRREQALHPFSSDPWAPKRGGSRIGPAIVAVVVVLVVLLGIVAIAVAT